MLGFYKHNEAFTRHFYRNGGFCLEIEGFSRIAKLIKYIISGIEAFWKGCEAFPPYLCGLYETYSHKLHQNKQILGLKNLGSAPTQ
jgi:hypothetical protein